MNGSFEKVDRSHIVRLMVVFHAVTGDMDRRSSLKIQFFAQICTACILSPMQKYLLNTIPFTEILCLCTYLHISFHLFVPDIIAALELMYTLLGGRLNKTLPFFTIRIDMVFSTPCRLLSSK
jgi:hypothetical protein